MLDITANTSLYDIQGLPLWENGEQVLERTVAGEGNMNLVLRIKTTRRSVILKQSKAYVRKYPQIPAPIERLEIEKAILEAISDQKSVASFSPRILHYHAENYLMLLEDLGSGSDFLDIYAGNKLISPEQLSILVDYLTGIHAIDSVKIPASKAMRALNHQHIFHLPFLADNGFNLDDIQVGLQALSKSYTSDERLAKQVTLLGKRYLEEEHALIHGDFYPGSWLEVGSDLKVIDPEFGGMGDAAFDLGVFLAHLDLAKQPPGYASLILERYTLPVDPVLVQGYRGVEILRRILGLAQLPLALSLEEKSRLLSQAKTLVLS